MLREYCVNFKTQRTAMKKVNGGMGRRSFKRFNFTTVLFITLFLAIVTKWLQLSGISSTLVGWSSSKTIAAQDDCPPDLSTINWSIMEKDPDKGLAAVYTPFNIVFGGGERYLLSTVAAMQQISYHVTVFTLKTNACKTLDDLLNVASGLEVSITPGKTSLKSIDVVNGLLPAEEYNKYSLFFSLGNGKLPDVEGIGYINFFMNQFPFDLDRDITASQVHAFSTYDYVLLNSEFSQRWYSKHAQEAMHVSLETFNTAPHIVVLHPPVYNNPNKPEMTNIRKNIVLLGRFFEGRQSKGHASAIRVFKEIYPHLPQETVLHLVGNLMPEHDSYLEALRKEAAGSQIEFHVSASSETVHQALSSSLVQWHMTGADSDTHLDPASEEHFGISIVEGMAMGTIPVLLRRGGVTDIVDHGKNGFLGDDLKQVAESTIAAFSLPMEDQLKLRLTALETVGKFEDKAFIEKFRVLAHRGRLTKPVRHLIKETSDLVCARSFVVPENADKAAIIIEPRQHYAFEYVVKNALHHLGPDWSLHIYHGSSNEDFVKRALASIKNVQFQNMDATGLTIAQLNVLLKSYDFWSQIRAKKVLFFQTDSLLVHGNIEPFLEYDYVGAPWHLGNERWKNYTSIMPQGVGNGGLSLRSVAKMRELSKIIGQEGSQNIDQEDFLYSYLMEKRHDKGLAPRGDAYAFCIEVPCKDLEAKDVCKDCSVDQLETLENFPLALHASWYYFSDGGARYRDLLRMLQKSVC